MTNSYLQEIKQELRAGVDKKDHPFRYFTLGTVGLEPISRQRTVVLREVEGDFTLLFYTDVRSKKIIHLTENNKVGLLFFHPKKLLQVRMEGLAYILKDEETLKKYWGGIQPQSRKDYTTVAAPGTALEHPDKLEYLNEENHFCIIKIVPHRMEYLKLKRPHHIRVQYSWEEDLWESEFLVP